MASNLPAGIILDDPRPIQAAAPYTFFLPPPPFVAAVVAGDLVKAIFRDDQDRVERMWVEVEHTTDDALSGRLANEPAGITAIAYGSRVSLPRTHVIDVRFHDDARHPAVHDAPREYWERCLVDACVLEGRSHVDYLYRETPDMTQDGDPQPDSGWRLRGTAAAVEQDASEDRPPQYVALGAVLNRDDRWLHLVDEAPGVAFQWSQEDHDFLRFDRPDLVS